MAKEAHQKGKLLRLRQLLLEQSDEDHPIRTTELIQALAGWNIPAERKSIYDDMDTLRQLGMDVQYRRGRQGGWFVGERSFQLAELKLLVDAVQSSRFITPNKSRALIRKLESLTSIHQARQLQRQVYVTGRAKSGNESVYYSIDTIHAALSAGKAVSFRYFEYNVKKERVFRRDGKRYAVSPYALMWDNENYYLVGYDHQKRELRHYRVDRMDGLNLTCIPLEGQEVRLDMASYAQRHFGMFRGQDGTIKLRCATQLVGVVLDRFGQDVILVPDGEEHFTVTVEAVVSPQFMGWIFGLGEQVELLSPTWAVEGYRALLDKLAKHYSRT